MIKDLRKHDILLTPFVASKKWNISNVSNDDTILTEDGDPLSLEYVDYGNGSSFPRLNKSCNLSLEQQSNDVITAREGQYIQGIFYPDSDPTNIDGTYKRVIYAQIKTMFYNDYFDPIKMWGMEYVDFETSKTKKFLTENLRLFSIPPTTFGEKIQEKSVAIYDNALDNDYTISDDGYENLFAGPNLFSKVQEIGDFFNEFQAGSQSGCENYFNSIGTCSAPIQLTASITSSVLLKWTDASTVPQEDGFVVERALDGLTYSTYAYTSQNVTSSHDTAVSESATYWYRVYAYNSFGNSGYSNTASITIPTSSLPVAPTLLTVISGSAILSWTDNSSDEDGFTVEKSVNTGSTWSYLTTTLPDVITVTDTSVVALGTYWYRMFAYNIIGSSSFSNTASIHFSASVAPSAPTSLTVSSGSAILTWNDNSSNEDGFYVDRSTNSGSTWANVITTSTGATGTTDSTVTTPNIYAYRVYAFNAYGTSSYSNTASINFTGSAPSAPTSLTVSSGSVILNWMDNSYNEDGFTIEKSTNSGSTWAFLQTASQGGTTSTDNVVTTQISYSYRVFAYNIYGSSSFSNTASIFFTASVPVAPVTFSYAVATETVTWSEGQVGFPNSGDLAAFRTTANLNLVTAISFPGGENINSVIIGDQMPLLNQLQINDPTPITTSVSNLPNTITQLVMAGCGFTDVTLPSLPSALIRLYVTSNPDLTTLPTLPVTLQLLATGLCTNFATLPAINTTVIDTLDVSNTALTSLPAIPNTMESLTIDNTLINPLPTLTGATNLQILSAQNDTALTAIPTLPVTVQEMYFNGCSNLATIPSLQGLTADYLSVVFADTALDAVAITNLCNQLDLGGTVGGYLNILGTGVPPGAALVSIGNLEMLGRDWSVDHD